MSKNKGKRKRLGFKTKVEKARVAVLTPCDDMVKSEYHGSMIQMLQRTYAERNSPIEMISVQAFGSSILPFSREQLAIYAINVGATHTLWIDSDMKFPADMLLRLYRHHQPIVGINAMSRREPYRNCAQVRPDEQLTTTLDSSGLEKVHRMGFGVVWIDVEIFKAMGHPYFDFEYVPEKGVWRGEDFGFFDRARTLGHEFYVDHDLSKEVFHMGSFGFNPVMMNGLVPSQPDKQT